MPSVNEDTYTGPSFPLSNRVRRFMWTVCWVTLFLPSPRPCHAWRALILRLWGAGVGKGTHIYPTVRIWAPWNVQFGDQCGIGDGANLYSQAKIKIGKRAVVSQGAHLCTGTHDFTDPGMPLVARPITIGDHAWVAAECFILPGVVIGEGAVIGARAVVSRDMPAWHICAGHPCRAISRRSNPQRE